MRARAAHPAIVVTKPDYERLFNLVESPQVSPAVAEYLMDELERAHIVAPEDVAPTVVTMQSRFIFKDESTGDARTASLVYPGGENIEEGCISIVTPVGAALLWTLEKGLGPDFTPETRAAWTEAYTALAGVMTNG